MAPTQRGGAALGRRGEPMSDAQAHKEFTRSK
jgi:hypothetical protein